MIATTDEIRRCFPALERIHDNRPVAYFDGPGGTQVPRAVADAMTSYLFSHNANTHWDYPSSNETDEILAAARAAVADFLGARESEIVFGANMTTLTFHLAHALGRIWNRGDEVIVTELDHQANVAPWRGLERDRGVVVRTARFDPVTAQLDLEHLTSLVSRRTKLIAVGGASNAVGTINDLAQVGSIARAAGALFFVDAVHLAPHELVDVKALDCDFLACSSYKFYGPHLGILFGREALLAGLPFAKLDPAPDTAPERAETGTQNHEGIAGAGAVVEWLASLAGAPGSRRERLVEVFSALHERAQTLTRAMWSGLGAIDGVRLYGPPPEARRTPTVAFTIDGVSSSDVARALAADAIFASHGDFYATTVVDRLGVDGHGLVRAGCACYTTDSEATRLVESVAKVAARSRVAAR